MSIYKIIGIAGLVFICLSMVVKHRTTRDIFGVFGGVCLLMYSLYLKDFIFIVLQGVYILVVLVDFINKKFVQHATD